MSIRHRILDFLAMIDRKPAHDALLDDKPPQRFFKCPRLRIGTVQNRKIVVAQAVLHFLFKNRGSNQSAFLVVVVGLKYFDEGTFFVFGKDFFAKLCFVARNDRISRVDDRLGRACLLYTSRCV